MNARVVAIAESVLRQCSREKPADAVLRGELRRQSGVSSDVSAGAADAVFAWHRWRGWLELGAPIADQLAQAAALDARFKSDPSSFSDDELVRYAVPDWAAEQVEVTPGWVRALQRAPRLWLRARVGRREELAVALGQCFVPPTPGEAVEYRGREDLFRSSEFQAGEFEVQDISSQAVGLLCDPKPGETWWDACAGEGGKMLHLSDLMANRGLIWASDRASWRLKRLKLRAARAKVFNYRAVNWEGGARLPTRTTFDGVLLDAPCSGLGTWQRNPHARWTTTQGDVHELAAVQANLLGHVAPAVKAGGRLIYSVCTVTRTETAEMVEAFERRFPEFQRISLTNPFEPKAGAMHGVWLWPQDAGGNGMFLAAWRRSK